MNAFCEKHVNIAKEKYYKKYFDQYKDCSKKQWQMINSLMNRNKRHNSAIKLKDANGKLINTDIDVSEKFNDYFSNIASNIKNQISSRTTFDPGGFAKFLQDPCQRSMYIKPVEPGEVHKVIKGFKNKSTLDTKIEPLKIANTSINFTSTLAKIINSSFEQGVFPQPLKIAKVVPIHKDGPKTEVANYRPISLLSSFSKVFENSCTSASSNF